MPWSKPPTPPFALDSGRLASPFFQSPEDRIGLARERFFGDGERPSGLVSEPVIQSWTRCIRSQRPPTETVAFDMVDRARVSNLLARHHRLLRAAREELVQLDQALAGSPCKAMLTSPDGVVLHATPTARDEGRLMPVIARVGVNIGEATVGTGAPGVAARTGEACMVLGGEHYFDVLRHLHCAAAPVRDGRGRLAAVLDLSSEGETFRFDAAALVRLYASAIENRLIEAQVRGPLLLRMQTRPDWLRSSLEGLLGLDEDGRVLAINAAAATLLGCPRVPELIGPAEAWLGLGPAALQARLDAPGPQALALPGGLTIWVERVLGAGRTIDAEAPPIELAPVPLRTLGHDAIRQTLAQCKGNLSEAARRLGVSRGYIYRRLDALREADDGAG